MVKESVNSRILWNKAGTAGAVIGLSSAAFIFISQAVAGIPSTVAMFMTNALMWLIKFIGCIWLMMFFMKRLCSTVHGVTNATTLKFGVMTSLLSALIYSAVLLANMLFISADLTSQQFDQILQAYQGILDANSLTMMEKMESAYPQIAFFSQLIYCFIYGSVLSLILSRYIPSRDPFAGQDWTDAPDEQDRQ